jgi:two-component system, NarL family, sensor histidine kinase DesK
VTATTEPTTATRPGAPDEHPGRSALDARPGRFGWLFAGIWLFYLLDPLQHAWTRSWVALPWRVATTVALLAFAAGFLWFFVWWRGRRIATGAPPRPVEVWRVFAVGAALLALAAPGGGQNTLNGLVYLTVAAAMTLPLRQALVVLVVCVGVVLGLPRVLPGWYPEDDFVPQLVLASFAAYGIGQVIVRNAELARAREQLVDLAVSRERERVARDVHDILGHSLTVITVKTELAGRLLEAVPGTERARSELADAERLAREALADVRATVSGLREVSLTGELVSARRALEAAGIAADLPTAVDVVPARHRQLFAWALREGVTNVVRHSGAAWCGVRLTADCVEVRDDGRGPGTDGGGSGLAGLRTRAAAAGARLETGRAPEGGFLLRVVTGGRR